VYAKDKANFDVWDVKTAQAKVDCLFVLLKLRKWEKYRRS
jgi:hypothetical protein